MSKVTFLDDLTRAWYDEKFAKGQRCNIASGRAKGIKWRQIVDAHHRRIDRIYGSKRRNRAGRVADELANIEFFSAAVRSNRKLSGMPPQVITVRNGKIHSWSD